jgi:hypothetical protein
MEIKNLKYFLAIAMYFFNQKDAQRLNSARLIGLLYITKRGTLFLRIHILLRSNGPDHRFFLNHSALTVRLFIGSLSIQFL